jgi:GT2 family glycosyltransferase
LDLKSIVSDFKSVSYIRCDYDSGFNYAMLANIGSFIMKKEQFSEVIFWNSDMYLPDNSTLKELIARHRKNSPVLSGTKLLYPEKNWKGERFGVERKNGEVDYSVQGKVQYGGSGFSFLGNNLNFFHTKVGSEREDLYVNCDKGVNVNNGAYCMADLEWLYNAGGFNPSFAKIYNDIDICLRAISERKQIHYYGKDIFLYHEESTNLNSIGEEKKDHQFMSDMMLFSKIWNIANYDSVVRF